MELVLLYASKTSSQCESANRLVLACRVLGLPLDVVSRRGECTAVKRLTTQRPRDGFQVSCVALPCSSRGRLGHAQVFAWARTALHKFSPDNRVQPAEEGFTAQALAYLTDFVRQEVFSLSEAAAPLVQTKRCCERLTVNELTESSSWHTVWQRRWKRPAHTNLLEGAVSEIWEERAARSGGGRCWAS